MLFAINEYWLFNLCKVNSIVGSFSSSSSSSLASNDDIDRCAVCIVRRNALLAFHLGSYRKNEVTT